MNERLVVYSVSQDVVDVSGLDGVHYVPGRSWVKLQGRGFNLTVEEWQGQLPRVGDLFDFALQSVSDE